MIKLIKFLYYRIKYRKEIKKNKKYNGFIY